MKLDKRCHDSTKLLWHMDRVISHFDHGNRIAPLHLDIGISKFCNVKCVFCYGKFQNMQPVYIAREPLLNLISDANEIGVRSIALVGDGEPTVNKYLYEALELSKSTNVDMAISTNGELVDTEEKCKTILSACTWMRFSISAGTREGYLKIHQKDCFDKVVENIKRMVEVKKKYGYTCEIGMQSVFVPTLMRQDMIEESKLAVALGVDYFVIKQYSVPDDGESGMVKTDLSEYDSPETISALNYCESLATEKTDIVVKWNIMKQKGKRPYNGCLSVPLISEISGDGTFACCGHLFGGREEFKDYVFGNIQETRLRDIVKSQRYWDIIAKMRNEFDVHKMCKGACRLDKTNEFCYNYLQRPLGINFI